METENPNQKDKKDPFDNRPITDDLLSYFKNNSRETISYVLLILGLLLLFYAPVYGGLIIGVIAGIYFGDEIVNYIKNWNTSISSRNHYSEVARHLITGGLAIAFFISAPAIFLGTALVIAIKQLFIPAAK